MSFKPVFWLPGSNIKSFCGTSSNDATAGFIKGVTDEIPHGIFVDTFLCILLEVPDTDLDLLDADERFNFERWL